MLLQTERLILRELNFNELDALFEIFSDSKTMRFYPKPFDRQMTQNWINRNIQSYSR